MTAFATAEELASYMQIDGIDRASADLALNSATGAIQGACRQTFFAVIGDTVTLDGYTNRLALPQRPVTAVTAVSLTDYYGGPAYLAAAGSWRLSGSHLIRNGYGWGSAVINTWGYGGWPALVTVTYNHGYTTVPADVKDVCLKLAADRFLNPQGLESEQVDDYSYRTHRGTGKATTADFDDLAALVRRYGPGVVSVPTR